MFALTLVSNAGLTHGSGENYYIDANNIFILYYHYKYTKGKIIWHVEYENKVYITIMYINYNKMCFYLHVLI